MSLTDSIVQVLLIVSVTYATSLKKSNKNCNLNVVRRKLQLAYIFIWKNNSILAIHVKGNLSGEANAPRKSQEARVDSSPTCISLDF